MLTFLTESLVNTFQNEVIMLFDDSNLLSSNLCFIFLQFVIFYACSLDPENCGIRFAEFLADIFICSSFPPLTR